MKKNIFYFVFIIVPVLFLYFYNLYVIYIEGVFSQDPLALTGFNRILHILLPLIIAIVLIFLSLYSLHFIDSKNFYILLTIVFLIYLVLSILPLFSNLLSLPSTPVAIYIMNDLPWYAGYYGGTLLFSYFYKKNKLQLVH